MELEIINNKAIPIFVAATTSAEPLINNNTSAETDGAKVSTEKETLQKIRDREEQKTLEKSTEPKQ